MKYLLYLSFLIGMGGCRESGTKLPAAEIEKPNTGISSPSLAPYCKFFQSNKTGLWVIKNMADHGSMLGYLNTPTPSSVGFVFFETEASIESAHVLECKDTTELKKYWKWYWDRESPKLKSKDSIIAKKTEYQ